MQNVGVIQLKHGELCVVDAELEGWLNTWKWTCSPEGYAFRYEKLAVGKFRKLYLHALINGTPSGFKTDHINGVRLDNRKSNLRTANGFQNGRNSKKHHRGNPHSKFKGVWKTKTGKWVSQITANRKTHCLGTFQTEQEAAAAWNKASSVFHADFARLNIING